MRLRKTKNYCGRGRCRPFIQELAGHAKLLGLYYKINGSHWGLFCRGIVKSDLPHPIQAPALEISLLKEGIRWNKTLAH